MLLTLAVAPLATPSESDCAAWAASGECAANHEYMRSNCKSACDWNECLERSVECEAAPHTLSVVCPGLCSSSDAITSLPLPCDADQARCDSRKFQLEASGGRKLKACVRWAESEECDKNAEYMLSACPLACAERSAAKCARWAAAGECETNGAWMRHGPCARACDASIGRVACDAAACASIHSDHGCALQSSGNGTVRRRRVNPPGYNETVELSVRNDGAATLQLFYAAEDGTETGYGVVPPGARLGQGTVVGHVWRLREVVPTGSSRQQQRGRLVRELVAGVVSVAQCACEAHLRSHHLRLGTLVPRGYRHEGSSELLVRQVWPGDLVTVVLDPPPSETSAGGEKVSPAGSEPPLEDRSAMSELPQGRVVLQHLATDLVVEECAAPVAPVQSLERRRQRLQENNQQLRSHLQRLQRLDESARKADNSSKAAGLALDLPAVLLDEYSAGTAEASALLGALEASKQAHANADASARQRHRGARRARKRAHDEL
ncbi:hypothetical protein EMIHUDRAFT_212198 [Emiliania huxleyi CCMP1516]|uniref:ShKT domain-containing protein n=2 Tax=Emiliania huxleyi TaxID=2903 RepID=A0A0D3ISC4_EMIH1|nr:hypothetical protein EMIHUDRAFT_212198 [Emiliania huxleyi CCMP1516]EOD14159.1 hypothetical protein EMIHUDRAFT_212198 [Emiliania huxleyi CCMP1516]|eukprot:XP_005766588.1 hypothetical protein EMIHUDRAFT_212198 [Emiliania huxleyi CCMP1516]